MTKGIGRRAFLRGVAATAATAGVGLAAGCGGDDDAEPAGAATAGTSASSSGGGGGGGGNRSVTLGFIALTDCAPIVMAQELGYFAERDLDVDVIKQASWPATRDALLNGEIDGAHCLFSMPLSVATGLGGAGTRDLKVAMMLNQNGQAITLASDLAAAGYGDPAAAGEAIRSVGTATLGMTFPGGTHDTWLRYWLLAAGIDLSSVGIEAIPPPQMVQNMSVDNVTGYCVGEPWNAVAVQQGIGFTALATQDLWLQHPEKALVVGSQFAAERTDVLKDVMGAVLQASQWLDDPANRSAAADTLGVEAFVNAPPDDIRGRLTGEYDLGADLGSRTFDAASNMRFFGDGQVPFPRRAHALWFLAQYQRFGLLTEAPPAQEIVDELILTDLYAEVAAAAGVSVPDDDMAPFEVVLDGATFDPTDLEAEVART
jgi:nitrate/nitrite transport system substrate-binding protein